MKKDTKPTAETRALIGQAMKAAWRRDTKYADTKNADTKNVEDTKYADTKNVSAQVIHLLGEMDDTAFVDFVLEHIVPRYKMYKATNK